ncbi:CaiB/BaiF CoA transferase family protein [Prosthecomicrobium pneumaticum]|uniref:Crotonobetainyl-CoA:carnitine CoA-transferase CaiB-like acyl-CoA transferase n=1 Tax=Prosthecomicrobium pneumaticum TaxID=81895 RepID=A0A7W9FPD3_9HYPH|nr:CaiB/BaiF CoA-transferase family protein [Prosthecomicrobium pneumaticum]MBB5754429.1 crotonobetainyl-CoA:carnitine CoA-transferase CaiB-like acyl-CoA transferase [Prosthecomicrobium pneumaticum]
MIKTTSPLSGLRVVELARILAGPWAGQALADLGADVVKVESLAGDDTRGWGPPFVERADGAQEAAYFHACNRGKRSIAVDFTKPEGQAVVRRLAAGADVVIENFKVGGLVKYGLDAAALRALNPRLVVCSITGFGQDGPYAARAGYDFMIQGLGGLMDLTGAPDGEPQKVGVAFADIFTGLYAVIAIQAALAARARTGEGAHLDMALFDSLVGVLANQALNYLASGVSPRRLGNAHPNIVPYQVFAVADGHVIVAVGNDGQFARFCRVIGVPDLAAEERFRTNPARVAHREALVPLLAARIAGFSRAALLAALEAEGVPAGPINTVADVFADPQLLHRGMRLSLADADGMAIPGVRTPILIDGAAAAAGRPSPRLGEHTDAVLAELGYDAAAVAGLRDAGAIG